MDNNTKQVAGLWAMKPWLNAALRAAALLMGVMLSAGALRGVAGGYDLSIWLIDARALPAIMGKVLIGLGGAGLVAWGLWPAGVKGKWRWVIAMPVGLLAMVAVGNVMGVYQLMWEGTISGAWVPVSLGVLIVLAGVCWQVMRRQPIVGPAMGEHSMGGPPMARRLKGGQGCDGRLMHEQAIGEQSIHGHSIGGRPMGEQSMGRRAVVCANVSCAEAGWWRVAVMMFLLMAGFPVVLVMGFGQTDYRRPADVIVVPGARVYADGRLSDALKDRMGEAVRLYQQGLAPVMIFSGGPGDGHTSEPAAMRDYAIAQGVPAKAIWLDEKGLNTAATARNVHAMMQEHGLKHALVVSHFFHLPRLKLAFGQEGLDAWTVPAEQTYVLMQMPWLVARESPAIWAYALGMAPGK